MFFLFLGDVSPPALVTLDWTCHSPRIFLRGLLNYAPFNSQLGVETGAPLTLIRLRANASVTSLWICLKLPLKSLAPALRQRKTTTTKKVLSSRLRANMSAPRHGSFVNDLRLNGWKKRIILPCPRTKNPIPQICVWRPI